MGNKCSELLYYSPNYKGKQNFSGEFSPVGAGKRKEYLAQYAKLLKAEYGLGALPKKVVADDEQNALVEKYACEERSTENVLYFNEMEAYGRKRRSPYLGWQFYTFGAKVKDGAVCFTDGVTPPVPAAKYEFDGKTRLTSFTFSVFAEKFETLPARVAVNNVRGRMFELRSGIYTVVKLQLFTDGNLYYLDGSARGTHPKLVFLCKCEDGAWTEIKIDLQADCCDISVNGQSVAAEQKLYTEKNPDNFFASGGMIPFGSWKLRPVALETAEKRTETFFLPAPLETEKETFLGNVKLPYAIGTYKNKDMELVFRKTFDFAPKKHAKLTVKSIDPCGFVYLNGKLVCRTEDFLSKTIETAQYLKEKDNLLEIVVLPRAPEVFYQWHRHSDPYNGWFFSGAYLETYDDNYVDELCVVTEKIVDEGVLARIDATLFGEGNAQIFLRKIYPEKEEERLLDSFAYTGKTILNSQYVLQAELWSPERPNLYEIVIRLDGGYEKSMETGFRTIEQKDGEILLNGNRVFLNGALSMQFLPPYENIPVNHLCPSDTQIVTQLEQVKRMNGNTLRMHFLGYGSNDERWARFADRAGCMLIWTTRLIDCAESVFLNDKWDMAEAYAAQVKEVRQYPSIIMWEGSNEACGRLPQIDKMYDGFVTAVKAVDKTRLLCPCSHLYYGGGLYDDSADNCEYYQENGLADQDFNPVKSSFGWLDKSVVRSAHTYSLTLGYGCEWDWLVEQPWTSQEAMLKSKEHAYIVSEYSIIGRMCPYTEEVKTYFNPDSYELVNEYTSLDMQLHNDEYELSQAHQALCALYANKKMRMLDADGMLWCCLTGGANDAAYLKPIIDFYGYPKLGYYVLGDYYKKNYCALDCDGPFWGENSLIKPVLLAEKGDYDVRVTVKQGETTVFEKAYAVKNESWITPLEPCAAPFGEEGYYTVVTEVEKREKNV